MKTLVAAFAVVFAALTLPVSLPAAPGGEDLELTITESQVIELTKLTCNALTKDAAATVAAINRGEAPYKDAANPTLYAFIYDPEVTMVAHPRPELVGKNVKGKPDVKGKKFRDEIVERAKSEGAGWVVYMYQKPGETGIHPKMTYFNRVVGSDGRTYIVCVGKYQTK